MNKRATRTVLVIALGAGLGYVTATFRTTTEHSALAAPAEELVSSSPNPLISTTTVSDCSSRANRGAMVALATTGLVTTGAAPPRLARSPTSW